MRELTVEQIAQYRESADRRRSAGVAEESARREKAWAVARAVADMLRTRFNVSRVVVFGSLARQSGFTRWSDIDIAVWGLNPAHTFKAMGAAWDADREFQINLVDVNCCKAALLAEIEKYGIDL